MGAMSGLKARIAYRVHVKDTTTENYWAGSYEPLGKPRSIPSPITAPNMQDASTLEDTSEVQIPGRRAANTMDIPILFEKEFNEKLIEMEGKELDFIIMYGNEGKGEAGKVAFSGTEYFAPGEATDGPLEGTCSIAMSTSPRYITNDYSVEVTEDANGYPTAFEVSAV